MGVSITGIILNIIILIVIIILIILGFNFNRQVNECESVQSPFCYTITCPCDDTTEPPCFGFAKMPGPNDGQFYCSNNPNVLVDSDGNTI